MPDKRPSIFEAVWNSATDAMVLSDSSGCVVNANPAYYRLYGHRPEEVLNQPFNLIFPRAQREDMLSQYKRVFSEREEGSVEDVSVERVDGTSLRVDVHYSFVDDRSDVLMLSVIRDVTQQAGQRDAERELAQQREAIFAMIAHDLRTPLTSIQGFAQLLRRRVLQNVPEENAAAILEGLDQIYRASRRMVALTEEMVDASRIRLGNPLQLEINRTDLVAIVESVVSNYAELSQEHQIETSGEEKVPGDWDARRLERVVDNLLSNAVKYSPNGGTITISILSEGDDAVLRIRDPGIGIPTDDQERIFDAFYRSADVMRGVVGSGLGLTGVRRIVAEHGGTVAVESELGEGSMFTVRLPITRGDVED